MSDGGTAAKEGGRARRPSARRKRTAGDTAERILKAARDEFAAHGLAGARVDLVARRARVNKRMIYHYFGSKEALYRAVLSATYAAIRDGERALELDADAPEEAMRRLVRFTFRHFIENPWFIRLLNAENVVRARYLKQLPDIKERHAPLVDRLRVLLDCGAERGVFRNDVDPVQLYITIASVGYFYLSNIHTLSTIFGTDLASPEPLEVREDHAVEVVLGYLKHRSGGNSQHAPAAAATAADATAPSGSAE